MHPELNTYFKEANKNYNERDLVSREGKILRPDRINVVENNTAVIIDYKTGVFNEQNERQIKEYKKAFLYSLIWRSFCSLNTPVL